MANYFESYSIEQLKREIEGAKQKIRTTNSQQDKLLLLALENELGMRNSKENMPDLEKFRLIYNKLEEIEGLLNTLKFDRLGRELLTTEGVSALELINSIQSKFSNGIH